jgi:hypothetical protein
MADLFGELYGGAPTGAGGCTRKLIDRTELVDCRLSSFPRVLISRLSAARPKLAHAHGPAVLKLTSSTGIQLNERVRLQRLYGRIRSYHRTISPRPDPPWRSRRSNILRPTARFSSGKTDDLVSYRCCSLGHYLPRRPRSEPSPRSHGSRAARRATVRNRSIGLARRRRRPRRMDCLIDSASGHAAV